MTPRLTLLGLAAAVLTATPLGAATAPPAPKLIVAISVDQFSAALFDQYRGRFSGGLKRMQSGVVFPNGYQSHAATETCPGHSTILTGRHPAATGIVANGWYDRASSTAVYCLNDPASPVPGRPDAPRGPANLRVPTLGEWLRAANPASRTFAVSGKDRGAITMAGHGADGTFWWDDSVGGFTTYVPAGTTPEARLAPVAAYNRALFASWLKKAPVWAQLDRRCDAGKGPHKYGRLTIDHEVPPAGWDAPPPGTPFASDGDFRKWFRATPMYDQIALDLASQLIDTQKLGRGAAPDVLAISLSATDYVGHRYGAGSPEQCDNLAHLDVALGRSSASSRHSSFRRRRPDRRPWLDRRRRASRRRGGSRRADQRRRAPPVGRDGRRGEAQARLQPADRRPVRDLRRPVRRRQPEGGPADHRRDDRRAALAARGRRGPYPGRGACRAAADGGCRSTR